MQISTKDLIKYSYLFILALSAVFCATLAIYVTSVSSLSLFDLLKSSSGSTEITICVISYLITFIAVILAFVLGIISQIIKNAKFMNISYLTTVLATVAGIIGIVFGFISISPYAGAINVGIGAWLTTILVVIACVYATLKLIKK